MELYGLVLHQLRLIDKEVLQRIGIGLLEIGFDFFTRPAFHRFALKASEAASKPGAVNTVLESTPRGPPIERIFDSD